MRTYFQKALSNMVFDAACGASIRCMAKRGCTTRQIMERLDYPAPFERVARAVTDYLLEQGILRREPPDVSEQTEIYTYVREQGKYGKTSFRKVVEREAGENSWKSWKKEKAEDFLTKKKKVWETAYISCDFGITGSKREIKSSVLSERQQEFLSGICWEGQRMYYRLDAQMEEIVRKLWENGQYNGCVYWR